MDHLTLTVCSQTQPIVRTIPLTPFTRWDSERNSLRCLTNNNTKNYGNESKVRGKRSYRHERIIYSSIIQKTRKWTQIRLPNQTFSLINVNQSPIEKRYASNLYLVSYDSYDISPIMIYGVLLIITLNFVSYTFIQILVSGLKKYESLWRGDN